MIIWAGLGEEVSTFMKLRERTSSNALYVGVSRLAEILNYHPKTIERMARTGRIPATRIDSRWRFSLDDIDSWLADRSLGTS
jgi:excisionase family DNA binding protein